MALYCNILARFVPFLFLASAILVGIRLIHDYVRPRHRLAGDALMIVFTLGSLGVTVPYIIRTSALIGAIVSYAKQDWEIAARRFDVHADLGGSLNHRLSFQRGDALIRSGEPGRAIESLQVAVSDPTGVHSLAARHSIGHALYKSGRYREADAVLRALPRRYVASSERDHLLARIAERAGRPDAALHFYERSLADQPSFFPSLHHAVKLHLRSGNRAAAERLVQRFEERNRGSRVLQEWLPPLNQMMARGIVDDVEFI